MNKALEALLTLIGQNTFNHDALTELLISKGVITEAELDAANGKKYGKGLEPAEWARRCMDPEDNEILYNFFKVKSK